MIESWLSIPGSDGSTELHDQALQDLRVLDISRRIPGHVCTKFMADFGADVILVEPPTGDPGRASTPFINDLPGVEKSGFFRYLNNNKRGITLDPETRAGAKIFMELVEWADLVVETFSPSTLPSMGLSYEAMKRRNPQVSSSPLYPISGRTAPTASTKPRKPCTTQ